MLVGISGFSHQASVLAQSPAPAAPPPTTAPRDKDFVLTRHYQLREALYTPPVTIALAKPAPQSPPGSAPPGSAPSDDTANAPAANAPAANAPAANEPPRYKSAEQVLIAQLMAMKSGDFNGWLRTWDDDSQQKIMDRERASQPNRAARLRQWQGALRNSTSMTLVRWIVTGPYVIVTYQIPPPLNAARKPAPDEIPVVFHLAGGLWRATLDLEQDPVLLHYKDPRTTWEQVIR